MNELQRLGYLEAMGVDSYAPRWRLPGAKASALCAAPVVAKPRVRAVDAAQPVGKPAPARTASAPAPDLQALLAEGESAARTEPRKSVEASRGSSGATPLRFALQIFQTDVGLLVVDGSRALQPESTARHFVANLSQAWAGRRAQVRYSLFQWPMASNVRIDQGEQAAREALSASLVAGAERSGATVLLLLGDLAASFAAGFSQSHNEVVVVHSHAMEQLFSTPALKAELWQHLQGAVSGR